MALIRIAKAKPLEGFKVELTLTTGEVVRRDLQPFLNGPVFDESAATKSNFGGCGPRTEPWYGRTALTFAPTL